MQSDGLNSALSPVVYGDIPLNINTQYNTKTDDTSGCPCPFKIQRPYHEGLHLHPTNSHKKVIIN